MMSMAFQLVLVEAMRWAAIPCASHERPVARLFASLERAAPLSPNQSRRRGVFVQPERLAF
jgi:hypothetical protein